MRVPPHTRRRRHWAVSPHHAVGRLTISILIGVVTYLLVAPLDVAWWVRAVAGWDAGALTLTTPSVPSTATATITVESPKSRAPA